MRKFIFFLIAAMSSWLILYAVPSGAGDAKRTLEGMVTYRARIALPASAYAIVEARGKDGKVIAETKIPTQGRQPPFPYTLRIPAGIEAILRAGFYVGGQPRWASEPIEIAAGSGPDAAIDIVVKPFRPTGFASRLRCGETVVTIGAAGQNVVLEMAGERFELAPVNSASGTRFEAPGDPGTFFQPKGRISQVSIRGKMLPGCSDIKTPQENRLTNPKGAEKTDAGGSNNEKIDSEQAGKARIGALPASFEGELPCTDCPAIRYHLDIFPDRLYLLRAKYEGTQRQLDTVGTWVGNPSGSLLTLQRERRSMLTFEVVDTANLLWPPRRMASSVYWPRTRYVLKRIASFQPVKPRATLTGMYRHVAGSGVFEICAGLSQSRLPVAQEGAHAALEAAYGHLVPAARGGVLAQFEGRIAMQPKPEGEGLQPTLVVERVIELKPGETCKTHLTAIQLEDTPWTLTHLGDGAVPSEYERTQPHFNLSPIDLRITGNAGCAQMTGRYTLDGSRLEVGRIETTMNAHCRSGMDIQRAFLAAIERVKTWRLDGRHLELLDVDGKPVARFQARN